MSCSNFARPASTKRAMSRDSTARPETARCTWSPPPSVARHCPARSSIRVRRLWERWPEMLDIVLFSALAAAGVLVACIALALPRRVHEADELNKVIATTTDLRPPTIRQRVTQPFEALADRSSQRRRLNGGLTLGVHLLRPNLNWRPPQFVITHVPFLLAGSPTSLAP